MLRNRATLQNGDTLGTCRLFLVVKAIGPNAGVNSGWSNLTTREIPVPVCPLCSETRCEAKPFGPPANEGGLMLPYTLPALVEVEEQ